MIKKSLNKILNMPDFLGIKRQSSETYELDLNRLIAETELSPKMQKEKKEKAAKIIDKYGNDADMVNRELEKLTGEYESKGDIITGYNLRISPDLKIQFLKKNQPRYILFSLRDKEKDADKKVVRFSESGGNSHLGIVGGIIGELDRYIGLSAEDIKLYQSHHNEEPTIIENEALEVKIGGGGFIYFEPKNKEILLSGKSKTFDLYNGDYAIEHQLQVHNNAKKIIEDWIQTRGIERYRVKII